jgi:predicted O-methyltransferase YrrM
MRTAALKLCKEVAFRTPLRRFFFPYYGYNMTAPQLCLLCRSLESTRQVPGSIVEIGCSTGMTTVFLNNYMDAQGIDKPYIAVDTFSGFVREDVRHEVVARGKRAAFFTGFRTNKQEWFDGTMRMNAISRVRSFASDINRFDIAALGPISFCLLDVDLFRPTRSALPRLFAQLSPGGVIAVDDCDASNVRWDGADQAYKEFCAEISRPAQIISGIGLIDKPTQP